MNMYRTSNVQSAFRPSSSQRLNTLLSSISTSQPSLFWSQLGSGYDSHVGHLRRLVRVDGWICMFPPLRMLVPSISDCVTCPSSTTWAGEAKQDPQNYCKSDQADYAECGDDGQGDTRNMDGLWRCSEIKRLCWCGHDCWLEWFLYIILLMDEEL